MGKCTDCYARAFCVGGCYHNNWVTTGDVSVSPERQCLLVKSTFKGLLLLYSSLSHSDKEALFGKSPVPEWAVGRSSLEILAESRSE
jgi:sulfatase maturation enzyme AslB (radical SAM superfamily)